MATTTILLREDVDNLGGRGEIVKVKPGYARNYLIPRKIASLATKGNIKQIEQERGALLKKSAHERSTAVAQAEHMQNVSLAFERKAGETGQLFGSVTSMDIADALQAQGYEIDRRKIVLKDSIKETGDFSVGIKLHREVTLEIPVTVTAEGGAAEEARPKKSARAKKTETETTETEENVVENSVENAEAEVDS
jgi:large subunit ribosomal protein L9